MVGLLNYTPALDYDPNLGRINVAYGGGDSPISADPAEQACLAKGGVWNAVSGTCQLPNDDDDNSQPEFEVDPLSTTYGGHRDIAHAAIDKANAEYGKQISAGTARPEDNPAFNQGLADANKQYAGITSADFEGLSPQEQYQLAAQSMQAAGIKNLGGGYNQDDPTQGFFGGIKDAYGKFKVDARDTLAEKPVLGAVPLLGPALKFGAKNAPEKSTYDALGGNTSGGTEEEQLAKAKQTIAALIATVGFEEAIKITAEQSNANPVYKKAVQQAVEEQAAKQLAAQQAAAQAAAAKAAAAKPVATSGSSSSDRDNNRSAAQDILDRARSNNSFANDTARTSSGNSYTESKIKEAANTGRFTGFNSGGMVGYNCGGKVSYNAGGKAMLSYNRGGSVPMFANNGQLVNHPFDREGEQFDVVKANLTPGEFVVDADSAHVFQPILERINSWEPGQDMPTGLLSPKGEEMVIKRKMADGNEITVKSGAESELGADHGLLGPQPMMSQEPVNANLGGILQAAGGLFNDFTARRNARRGAQGRADAGRFTGGLNSLGASLDNQAAQAGSAGFRTNSLGSWGPNGYQGANFSSRNAPATNFAAQLQPIGQGEQVAANAQSDYLNTVNDINANREAAFRSAGEYVDQQNRLDQQAATDEARYQTGLEREDAGIAREEERYQQELQQKEEQKKRQQEEELRSEISDYESSNREIDFAISKAQQLEAAVIATGKDNWNLFAKEAQTTSGKGISEWLGYYTNNTAAGSGGEELQSLLEQRALRTVYDKNTEAAGNIQVAISTLADLATAALKAQGPGVKTNFDFKVAKDTIGQVTAPYEAFLQSIGQFITRSEQAKVANNEAIEQVRSRFGKATSGAAFNPLATTNFGGQLDVGSTSGLLGNVASSPSVVDTTSPQGLANTAPVETAPEISYFDTGFNPTPTGLRGDRKRRR